MTTCSPASLAMSAASWLTTPSCIHGAFAPMSTASLAIGGTSCEGRKTSTILDVVVGRSEFDAWSARRTSSGSASGGSSPCSRISISR